MGSDRYTRRTLLARGGAAAVTSLLVPAVATGGSSAAAAQRGALLGGGRFADGIASGEPTPRSAVLWTRIAQPEKRGVVELEVARDAGFRRVVARERIATGPAQGGSVKALVAGLAPHEQYFYRFATRTSESPVGRFRTAAPADSDEPVRFAFFSCQDYTHGWYNALEHMAEQDLDFAICLGDYIYAEAAHTIAGGTGVRDDTIGRELPDTTFPVAVTLDDYRAKYSLYRSDGGLRAAHAAFPLVATWDDHEVQNDYNGNERDGGLAAGLGYTARRRAAAYRAWFENMPLFPAAAGTDRIHRRLRFGRTVDLLMLDERQYRDAPPRPDGSDRDERRAFLGAGQMRWAKAALAGSDASWKVVGNQLMMMPANAPGGAMLQPYLWHGYVHEREELLAHIAQRQIRDVVFVTGDIHTFFAGEVRRDLGAGDAVALEFVGGSIASAGIGERDLSLGGTTLRGNNANPSTPPAVLDLVKKANPWLAQVDTDHHGYGLVEARRGSFDCRFVRMETVKRRTTATLPEDGYRWQVRRGQTALPR